MKTSNLILIGGLVTAYLYKDKLFPYIGEKASEVKDLIKSNINHKLKFSPKGLPNIKFDLGSNSLKLNGAIEVANELPISAKLNTYKLLLMLKKGNEKMVVGSTPLSYPNKEVKAGAKTSISYQFNLNTEGLIEMVGNIKALKDYQMYVILTGLKVDSVDIPDTFFKVDAWEKITSNPLTFITDLIK